MYDTVGMFLENNFLKEGLLTNPKETYNQKTGEIIHYGYLENLRVKVNGDMISVIGSFPKFYFGDNLQLLTRRDTELAIEKASDLLQLPLEESKIFRLDIGANFILNEPLQNYYSCLGQLSRFKKSQIANNQSLLYTTSQKTLEFYDKKREMKRSRQNIPVLYSGKNILRYELHLTKNINGSLKIPELRAKHLYEENNYIKGIDSWKDYYFSIQRINQLRFNPEAIPMLRNKNKTEWIAIISLTESDSNKVLQRIESSKGYMSKMQYSRLKRKFRELNQIAELIEPNEAIKELDSKVLRVIKHYR